MGCTSMDLGESRLVYGLVESQNTLAFLPENEARGLSQELLEIGELRTVGQARLYTSTYTTVPGIDALLEDGADENDEYSAADTGEFWDGDWPPMVGKRAMEF